MRQYLKEDIWTYYHEMYERMNYTINKIDAIRDKIDWKNILTYIDSWEDSSVVKAQVLKITIKFLDRLVKFVK